MNVVVAHLFSPPNLSSPQRTHSAGKHERNDAVSLQQLLWQDPAARGGAAAGWHAVLLQQLRQAARSVHEVQPADARPRGGYGGAGWRQWQWFLTAAVMVMCVCVCVWAGTVIGKVLNLRRRRSGGGARHRRLGFKMRSSCLHASFVLPRKSWSWCSVQVNSISDGVPSFSSVDSLTR